MSKFARLSAGGRWIQTIGPGTKEPVFLAEGELRYRARAAKKGCFLCGTDGSNPSPSSGESDANLTSSIRDIATVTEGAALQRGAVRMPRLMISFRLPLRTGGMTRRLLGWHRAVASSRAGVRRCAVPAIALLQDAMPRPGLPLVHFNDTRCGSVAELRSVILKARRLAGDDAERERAAAAVKTWLLGRNSA